MSHVLYPPTRPQRVGEILDSAFRIFRVSLIKCVPLAALMMIAGQSANIYSIVRGLPIGGLAGRGLGWWLCYGLGVLLSVWLNGTLILRLWHTASARQGRLVDELSQAGRRLPAALGLLVMTFVAFAIIVFPGSMLQTSGRATPSLMAVLVLVYLVVFMFMMIASGLSWITLLLTARGLLASVTYALRLMVGNLGRIFGVLLVTVAVALVFNGFVAMLAPLLGSLFGANDVALTMAIMAVLVIALGAITVPFFVAVALALFGDLQLRKEGTDLQQRILGTISD